MKSSFSRILGAARKDRGVIREAIGRCNHERRKTMFETVWNLPGKEIYLSTEYIGGKEAPWMSRNDNLNHVYVSVNDSPEETFEAWGSLMEPQFDDEYSLKNIFQCICEEALNALWEDWDDILSGLSWSEGDRIVQGCRATLAKLENLGLGDEDTLLSIVNDEEWQ